MQSNSFVEVSAAYMPSYHLHGNVIPQVMRMHRLVSEAGN